MSGLTIRECPPINPLIQGSLPSENPEADSNPQFWFDRLVKNGIETLSSARVQIICSRILGGGALAVAGVVVGLAACSIVALPAAAFALPALALAGYAFWYSTQFDDDTDLRMVAQLKEEAQQMTLDQVVARHGLEKIFEDQILSPSQFVNHYRKQVRSMTSINDVIKYYNKIQPRVTKYNQRFGSTYFVPHPREQASRWRPETEKKTFKEIVEQYSVNQLENLGIVGHHEICKIRELLGPYEAAKRVFQGHQNNANTQYDAATTQERERLNARKNEINRQRTEHPVIRSLEGLANEQLHSQLRIGNQFNEELSQARQRHTQAISRLISNRRAVDWNKLSSENRAEYDRETEELSKSEQRIKDEKERQLRLNDRRFAEKKQFLESERVEILAKLQQEEIGAIQEFNERTRSQQAAKNEALTAHQARFDRIAANLDEEYKAYLGQLALNS